MKLACALGASLLLLGTAPAFAQSYPGEEVTVNPGAIGSGYLLYPGGRYGRHVGHLLQPGEAPGATIHLHMPRHHAAPPRVARAPQATTIPLDTETAAPPPQRHVARTAPPRQVAATPPPVADQSALPEDSATRFIVAGTPPPAATPPAPTPAKPVKPPKPARHVASVPPPDATTGGGISFSMDGETPVTAAPPPRRTARNTPPPANTTAPAAETAGLRRQSVIPFAAGASSPASADVNAIHTLATALNVALARGSGRVQLEAYGGPRGDKSSDSRRLSLKRALVVRELLIEDGVPSEKIDVRAMGGADDAGAADRVDVLLQS